MGNEIQLGIRITADGNIARGEVKSTRVEIEKLSASSGKLASDYSGLDKAIATTSTSTFKSSDEFRKLDGRLASLLSTIDPVYRSTRQLDSGNELLHQGMKSGLLTHTQYQSALDSLAGKFGVAGVAAGKSALGTAQARRELIVLGHEAISGNFARMPGSFMVLAAWNRRSGWRNSESRPSSVRKKTATSPPLAATRSVTRAANASRCAKAARGPLVTASAARSPSPRFRMGAQYTRRGGRRLPHRAAQALALQGDAVLPGMLRRGP